MSLFGHEENFDVGRKCDGGEYQEIKSKSKEKNTFSVGLTNAVNEWFVYLYIVRLPRAVEKKNKEPNNYNNNNRKYRNEKRAKVWQVEWDKHEQKKFIWMAEGKRVDVDSEA